LLKLALAAVGERETTQPTAARSLVGTGTGFLVTKKGHVLTNKHVVKGCRELSVSGIGKSGPATVEEWDEANDLAILTTTREHSINATFRRDRRASLGERIVVAGFPLRGILSGDITVTTGVVNAMAGPQGDARLLQISAPVQAGNSGGPVLDKYGNVMGTIVAKLDAVEAYEITGDIPQNVNFAIKGTIVKSFLDIHGIEYEFDDSSEVLDNENIAANARRFTVSVECWK
jgi:S1-C subfamily serine protease